MKQKFPDHVGSATRCSSLEMTWKQSDWSWYIDHIKDVDKTTTSTPVSKIR